MGSTIKENMKNNIIIGLCLIGSLVVAAPKPINNPAAAIQTEEKVAVKQLKASDSWINMQTQLDQYTNHLAQLNAQIITATNKIELVVDAATAKTALQKVQNEVEKEKQMLDDLHDAVKKMSKILIDYVNLQNK